jgi:hypothetical protein
MNDPHLFADLDDLGAALDPASPRPPARLRSRVLMAMAESPQRRKLPVLRRPTRRFTLAAVATVGLAGVLVAVPTLRVGSAAPPATAQAQEILTHAATVAANAPVLKADKNQFVYIKTYAAWGDGSSKNPKVIQEEWLSVDGTRNGRSRTVNAKTGAVVFDLPVPGCINGMLPASDPGGSGLDGKPIPCRPIPAYRDDLPSTTAGMYKYLYTIPLSPGARSTDQEAFVVAGDLIRSSYLPPASLAALFNAVAEIPGVFVRQNVADASGRVGIAVARTELGGSSALLFDPKTYQFIGEATARAGANAAVVASGSPSTITGSVSPGPGLPASAGPGGPGYPGYPDASPSPTDPIDTTSPVGPFTGNSAVLKLAIVDRVDQRP